MEENGTSRAATLMPWALCVAGLLGPAMLVWVVRLSAAAAGCTPGPELCHSIPFGAGLRDALALAWVIPTSGFLLGVLSLAATLFAFRACRPLTGTLSMLVLPILAPVLPMLAVIFSRYGDCAVSGDGIGNCRLWGAAMGMSFHNAAVAHDVLYSIFPYTFALTMMLGVLGFCFARPKADAEPRATAHMSHDDERYS
jgi:hypothetical protein